MTLWRPTRSTFVRNSIAWFIAAFLLAAVVVIGNSKLVHGKATPIWDAADYYAPMFTLVADHVKAGKLFLWNPWINGGSPDFADPQSGATSPVLLAFAFFATDSLHGFVAYWLTIWIFGGIGMLLLCRHLRCPVWGAFIAALGFVASGFYTGHGEHTTLLYSLSFIPWILWRFDVAVIRKSYWNMIEAAVLWGLSALGGYPALVICDPIFLTLWGFGRSWLGSDETLHVTWDTRKKNLIFTFVGLCLFGIIGAAVMAPSYIGFLIYGKGYTNRASSLSRDYVLTSNQLPPQAIATFASPVLYLLNLPPDKLWPATDVSMSNVYLGLLVAPLAIVALFRGYKWRLWLGIIIIFFMACAVGDHLPVRGWVYDLVPPTRFFRFPSLFSAYGIVGFCILAAYGSRDLDLAGQPSESARRGRFVILFGVTAIIATSAYLWMLHSAHLQIHNVRHPSRVFLLLWISAITLLLLWWSRDITSRLLVFGLMILAICDATSALNISIPTMYSRSTIPWWEAMRSQHSSSLDLTPHGFDRTLFPSDDLMPYQHNRNVVPKLAALANDTGMVNGFFQPYVYDPVLNQLAIGPQRIWFSADPIWLAPDDNAFAKYQEVSHRLGVPPLVLHTPEQMLTPSDVTSSKVGSNGQDWTNSAQPLSHASVELLAYSPNRLSFRYSASGDGWLLVTDRWARFWKAAVNGRPVEVDGANFIFRAVPVTRGDNVVQFDYEPRGYLALVVVSWGIIALVALWEIALLVFPRQTARAQQLLISRP